MIVACGVIDGGAVMLLAWRGLRYSLGSQRMRSLVVLSFLVAYLLYLVVAQIPGPTSIACLRAALASWALWRSDAVMRHELSSEVFPSDAAAGEAATPGEFDGRLVGGARASVARRQRADRGHVHPATSWRRC